MLDLYRPTLSDGIDSERLLQITPMMICNLLVRLIISAYRWSDRVMNARRLLNRVFTR